MANSQSNYLTKRLNENGGRPDGHYSCGMINNTLTPSNSPSTVVPVAGGSERLVYAPKAKTVKPQVGQKRGWLSIK